ncbi:hypothetical protein Tco_0678815 [Tanacetum coccineum]|uniref:Reverse transcriptase domain-containing protein n=1 Tax=Tanacetum coccineum TaxID=301880 RepID=A0ABQ4XGB1_9ASTR
MSHLRRHQVMTQAAIRKLVVIVLCVCDSTRRKWKILILPTRPREAPVARQCSYKEFMSCQPINFKGTEGAIGLIRWFERTELVFSRSNCTKDYKVKVCYWQLYRRLQGEVCIGTLLEEALAWRNFFCPKPIGLEEVTKITGLNSKKLFD